MSIPYWTVTGTVLTPSGQVVTGGTVTFDLSEELVDPVGGTVVAKGSFTVNIDSLGRILGLDGVSVGVLLPATSGGTLSNTTASYHMTISPRKGSRVTKTFALTSNVDIANLVTVSNNSVLVPGITQAQLTDALASFTPGTMPFTIMSPPSGGDDTAAVQAALDALHASPGYGQLFLQPGTYRFATGLTLYSNIEIAGAGQYVTNLELTAGSTLLTAQQRSNIVLRDFTILGNRSAYVASSTGIRFGGTTDSRIQNVAVDNLRGSGILVNTSGGVRSARCWLERVIGTRNNQAITVTSSDDITITNSRVDGSTLTGSNGNIALTDTLRAAVLHTHSTTSAADGIYASAATDLRIEGCVLRANGGSGAGRGVTILGTSVRPIIMGNTVKDNQENGIYFGFADVSYGALIEGNVCTNNNVGATAGGHGIEVNGVRQRVIGNYCEGGNAGISSNGNDAVIQGNMCIGAVLGGLATHGNGIKHYNGARALIANNHCMNNAAAGIDINGDSGFSGLVVIGNVCTDTQVSKTQTYGIAISNDLSSSLVTHNICSGNLTGGISNNGAGSVTLTDNITS